eukprot:TRINITY_DN8378_c0_g1_i1.p1 TRINITY_DN8378_c0_g1~~TRINITY_DN8378_c0_g1_i1.p1  ORF type:complete len:700 (-),score=167.09 TRINITY_DN8378_c0_g1_i1:40-2139(-)
MEDSNATEMVDLEKGAPPSLGGEDQHTDFDDIASMPLPELPVLVHLKNVACDLVTEIPGKSFFAPKQQIKKSVFRNVNFQVTPGELLAIMGPTGCGKTSLLNVIGGRNTKGITGDILFNNAPRTKELKRITGYVLQDDLLFGTLTVHQTLAFTAALRLPLSAAERNKRVEEILEALNLKKCRNTIIGNQWVRGVSGGERKRTNIGNELITNPSLILLDEPTSGLDSFTAEALLSTLQAIAKQGRTIITTIHQPSSQIFAMFDKILLMCEGNMVYYGPAKEVVSYFSRLGHECPINYNPADFMLGLLVSEEMKGTVPLKNQLIEAYKTHYEQSKNDKHHFLSRENERRSTLLDMIKVADEQRKSRKNSSAVIAPPSKGPTPIKAVENTSGLQLSNVQTYRTDGKAKWWQKQGKYPTSWFQQAWILLQRCMLLQRDKMFDKNPLLNVLIVAVIVGLIFLRLENKESAIQDRISVSFFIGVFAAGFVPLIAGVFSIPSEETVIRKERAAGAFGLSAYYIAKSVADIPLQLVYGAIFVIITYWMVGLNSDPRAFFSYLGICLLSNLTCYSLGMSIGCLFPRDLPFASLIAMIAVLGSMLVGGFYIPLSHLPWWIRWLQYISVIRYMYMCLLCVDLKGEFFTQEKILTVYDQFGNPITGEEILTGVLDLEPDLVWAWALVLLGFGILFRTWGYVALRYLNKPQA